MVSCFSILTAYTTVRRYTYRRAIRRCISSAKAPRGAARFDCIASTGARGAGPLPRWTLSWRRRCRPSISARTPRRAVSSRRAPSAPTAGSWRSGPTPRSTFSIPALAAGWCRRASVPATLPASRSAVRRSTFSMTRRSSSRAKRAANVPVPSTPSHVGFHGSTETNDEQVLACCRDAGIRGDHGDGAAVPRDSGRHGRHGRPFALPGERPARGSRTRDARRQARDGIHRGAVPGARTRARRRERDVLPAGRVGWNDAPAHVFVGQGGKRAREPRLPRRIRRVGGTARSRYLGEWRGRLRRLWYSCARVAVG